MSHSPELDQLAAALCKAQSEMPPVPQNARNPFYKSKYADLETVWSTVQPHLAANGLAVSQATEPSQTPNSVDLVTILLHTSGQWIAGRLTVPYGLGKDNLPKVDPQGMGSGITYGRRYALSAILCIVTDEDTDGNAPSRAHTPAPQRQAPPHPAPRQAQAPRQSAPAPQGGDGNIPVNPPLCPVCGGDMWDNRERTEGTKAPRWKCKKATWDKETRTAGGCPGVVWTSDPMEDDRYVAAWTGGSAAQAPPAQAPEPPQVDDAPPPPQDDDIPF